MFENNLFFQHDMESGPQNFRGRRVKVSSGCVEIESEKIAKRLARDLSEDYGRCHLIWSNMRTRGQVTYILGSKVFEEFHNEGVQENG